MSEMSVVKAVKEIIVYLMEAITLEEPGGDSASSQHSKDGKKRKRDEAGGEAKRSDEQERTIIWTRIFALKVFEVYLRFRGE
tara:strand:+ start:840 stop:1085 length:246 start_codon:yes stop_codon:yes gene_type:complete